MLRVNSGPWAPLRLSSMLSRPATGITRISVMAGEAEEPMFIGASFGPPAATLAGR